jgi:hypothetical protein
MTSITAPAPATPKIVGKALYLELVANPNLSEDEQRSAVGWQYKGTKQILIFPEYQDDTGRTHNPIVMSRVVSSYSPRSQWDTYYTRGFPKPLDPTATSGNDSYVTITSYSKEEWDLLPEVSKLESKKLAIEVALRTQLMGDYWVGEGDDRKVVGCQAWVIRDNKPIVVEVTDEDFDDLNRKSKTPQAVIRRINKVRSTLDKFPEKLA